MKDLSQCSILIVDDTEANLDILVEALGDSYEVLVATDGTTALEVAAQDLPDLILLDIMMPDMDGYEVCLRLKADTVLGRIPIIFLTALTDVQNKTRGFQAGAVDYVTKPFEPLEILARVKTHLSLVLATRELEMQNEMLEMKVAERTRELALAQDVTIHSLASLAETRDTETGMHVLRTRQYVKALATRLAETHPTHALSLDKTTIELYFKSAPLHDIGKVGVPDAILLKPGTLTDAEFTIMKTHSELGYQALLRAEQELSLESHGSFLSHARDIARTHHERWDGSGYPRGLKGDAIPLSGRIMAVADVYDALISRRVYKPPFPHETAVDIIRQGKGTHFDPDVVQAFLELTDTFKVIALEFADTNEE
ncbi:MAG: two-component system response regulator [Pseudomonadota bacterium]